MQGWHRLIVRFSAMIVFFSPGTLIAEQIAEPVYAQLNPLVVTGTRTTRSLADSPVRTQVVDRDTLDHYQPRDLAAALRHLPGVYLRTTHGKEGQEVWMQGLDSERVLVLINGVPAIASTGSSVDLTQIAITDIERIEVVRGATSALYGSSAMGGVINIITRQPDTSRYRIQALGGTLGDAGDGDPLDRSQIQALASLAGKRAQLEINLDWRKDEGYTLKPDAFAQDGHQLEQLNLNAQLNLQTQHWGDFSFRSSWFQEDKSKRQATPLPGGMEARSIKEESVEQPGLQMVWKKPTPLDGEIQLQASGSLFQNITQDSRINGSPLMRREAEINNLRTELQWSSWWHARHQVTLGALARQETLDQFKDTWSSTGREREDEIQEDAEQTNLEAYLQDNFFITDSLELLIGARYQHDSDFGSFVTPSATLFNRMEHKAGQLNQRLSLGRGYRVPNLKERYFVFDQSDKGYQVLGNPDLEPESSWSLQAGADWQPKNRHHPSLDINFFFNDIEQLIIHEYDPQASQAAGLQVYNYQNQDNARTWGSEVSSQWQPHPNWKLQLGYTWLQTEDPDTGLELSSRPTHQIKGDIGFNYQNFELTLLGEYQSREFTDSDNTQISPAWQRFHLRANYHLKPFTLLAGIDNLFDELPDLDDHNDLSPKPGRYVFVGLRLDGHF